MTKMIAGLAKIETLVVLVKGLKNFGVNTETRKKNKKWWDETSIGRWRCEI